MKPKFDFSGYATKIGLKCSDGRTILKDAFKHMDGERVPLVWQHLHDDPMNVLGHAVLENREDGIYAFCKLNNSDPAKQAKELISHGDITALSIFASEIKEKSKSVFHGRIHEISLVLSGANPGALIDNLSFAHGDGTYQVNESEAIIYTGLPLKIESDEVKETPPEDRNEKSSDELKHAAYAEDATVQDIFDTLDDTQKKMVYAMVAQAIDDSGTVEHSDNEGDSIMKNNIFDRNNKENVIKHKLTRDDFNSIIADAKKTGSLRDAVLAHASTYGIDNIEVLFPDARNVRNTPDMITRDDDWVSGFLRAVHKNPFSRIRSQAADITADEARAKGYITGERKKEEVFPVLKRITTPTTIYKKQKLDRDDIIDITDFDVVAWIRAEMRRLLDEEIARAMLIGDGREADDHDHINTQNVRPIWTDDELYAPKKILDEDTQTIDFIDEVVRARKLYKGSGSPNLYTTEEMITDMMLVRDLNQRRIYNTLAELSSALRVANVIAVEVMEDSERTLENSADKVQLKAILVNPKDYTVGADKGGEINMFDDFDIDYNQYKYLMETRISGALTKPKSAVVLEQKIETTP